VLLAGATVCVATISLAIVGVPLVSTLGYTTDLFVAVTVVAALTLLPGRAVRAGAERRAGHHG